MRDTRKQRYKNKEANAVFLPVSLVTVEFQLSCNLGLVIRSAACFGVKDVHVIGHVPEYKELKQTSGSTIEFVNLIQHNTPSDFLSWRRKNEPDSDLISIELTEGAELVSKFRPERHSFIVVGNETSGVPTEILHNSRAYYIDMPGIGFCLNTSQAAHVVLYELTRK